MTSLRAMLVSGTLLTAPAVMALDLPPEGEFSVTYYNIYQPSKAVPTADNKNASITEETQIFANDAGNGFLHNATGRCVFMTVGNPSEAQNSGYCTRVDADGDMIFMSFNGIRSGTESKGSSKYLGGTGKYVSLTGSG